MIKEKDKDEIIEETLKNSNIIKEKFDLLLEVLDRNYLTDDNYANDIYFRDDVIKAINEVLDGSYKNHTTCYNCKREGSCKYESYCKHYNPNNCMVHGDYFTRKD